MSNADPRATKISQVLASFKAARTIVAPTTVALLKGGGKLGIALVDDVNTLSAKLTGSLWDYGRAEAYSASSRQLKVVFDVLEERKGRRFSTAERRALSFFSGGMGLSPTNSLYFVAALLGMGVYGNAVKGNSEVLPIEAMAASLDKFAPNFPINSTAMVVGTMAVTAMAACRIVVSLGRMRSSASFEQDRAEARKLLDELERSVATSDVTNQAKVDELVQKREEYRLKFCEGMKLSESTVAAIKELRSLGAAESTIDARISESADEHRWVKKLYSSLIKDHLFSAPAASRIAHDLLIRENGDIPLIQNRLFSREIPQSWVSDYGFNERTVVGEIKRKDRNSELLRLATEGGSMAMNLLTATAAKVEQHYSRKPKHDYSTQDGDCSLKGPKRSGGMRP